MTKQQQEDKPATPSSQRSPLPTEKKGGVNVNSEVGRLRRVFVHTPGREVELMTPKTASELLYNDILQNELVQDGHAQLKGVLSLGAQVFEVKDCLRTILHNPEAKQTLLTELTAAQSCSDQCQQLLDTSENDLAEALVSGVTLRKDSLERYLSGRSYALVPLPNMYFMRDSSMVVGNKVISAAMQSPVRAAEALIMRALFRYHPDLKSEGFLLDGCQRMGEAGFSIEGGDVLVLRKNLLLVGLSERTSAAAVDALLDGFLLGAEQNEDRHVLCVLLPKERSTIHLDMIFTMVNREQAVIFSPYILGRERVRVVSVKIKAAQKQFAEEEDLLSALRKRGLNVEPIFCGGQDSLHQQREQWNSASNLFAFAPGHVLAYGMNEHTARACERAGFQIVHALDLISQPELLKKFSQIVVTLDGSELARGGGGPRCMTCPLERDD